MAILKPIITYAWAEAGATTDPGTAKIQLGWISEVPTYQNFNWILNRVDQFLQHINERGIPEYDASTTYIKNSLATGSDGYTYKSLVNPNTGNSPVGDGDVNWQMQAKEEQWEDLGHIATFVSSDNISITGVDVTSLYTIGRRVSLKGPTMGIIYGEIFGIFFNGSDTLIFINIDENKSIVSEAYEYFKVSIVDEVGINLPFGLSGLNEPQSKGAERNSILRKVTTDGVNGVKYKLVLTPPDIKISRDNSDGVGAPIVFESSNFIRVSIRSLSNAPNLPDTVVFTNTSAVPINVRYSLNKAAWVTTNLGVSSIIVLTLGANGFIEMTACNFSATTPKFVNYKAETDGSNFLYSYSSLAQLQEDF